MNRVKEGSGWEFLLKIRNPTFTWNPASGCVNFNCAVRRKGKCWAEQIVKRLGHICPLCPPFKPHMHDRSNGTPNRLWEPSTINKGSAITPVSTGDLFGLPLWMTKKIFSVIKETSQHIFAVLTKVPENAHSFNPFPSNVWFGVGINEKADVWRLDELKKIEAPIKWAIFEPLYGKIDHDLSWLDWIIVGPQTNPDFQPRKEWVQSILDNAEGVPIFMKSTLNWEPKRRERIER